MLGVTASQLLLGVWDRPGSYHAASQVNAAKPLSPSRVHRRMPRSATSAKNHRTPTSSTPRSSVARRSSEKTLAVIASRMELIVGLISVIDPFPRFIGATGEWDVEYG